MASGAPIVLALLALVGADRDRDLGALGAANAAERASALQRLRGSLTTGDLDALLGAAAAGPRARAAVVELLLERRDLGRAWIGSLAPDEGLLRDVLRGALQRTAPGILEGDRDPEDLLDLLRRSLPDSTRIRVGAGRFNLDGLAYEMRRAALFPFPVLVDPAAPAAVVDLADGAGECVSILLEAPWEAAQAAACVRLTLFAAGCFGGEEPMVGPQAMGCGEMWVGGKRLPAALIYGAEGGVGAERAWQWWSAWRSGTGVAAERAGVALVELALSPVDAAVAGALLSTDGARVEAAFAALAGSPRRGAALLAEEPRALDAFLGICGKRRMSAQARRVLEALPATDAAGRSCGELLVASAAAAAERAPWIEALARRREASALPLLREAARSGGPEENAVALRGLRRLDPPRSVEEAMRALTAGAHGARLEAAFDVLARTPSGPEAASAAIAQASGPARAAAIGAALFSGDPAVLAHAAQSVDELMEPADAERVARAARAAAVDGSREALAAALRGRNALPSVVVASFAGLLEPEQLAAASRGLSEALATTWRRPALLALGAIADEEAAARWLLAPLSASGTSVSLRAACALALVEFVGRQPAARRAELRGGADLRLRLGPAVARAWHWSALAAPGPAAEELRRALAALQSEFDAGIAFPFEDATL
ncbi:MAG: hypothetical protein JNJ88_10070 [Planctomycetes bacterium]|nr:hypothetical protein [Planctomycetota bacterium]